MIPDQNITALIERLAGLDTIITRIDAKRQSFILLLDDQGENNLSKPSSLNEWGLPKNVRINYDCSALPIYSLGGFG